MNHYSVIKGCIRFKKLWRNPHITRYSVVKQRCLLDIIPCLYKYVDLASKVSYKDAYKKRAPLAISLLLPTDQRVIVSAATSSIVCAWAVA